MTSEYRLVYQEPRNKEWKRKPEQFYAGFSKIRFWKSEDFLSMLITSSPKKAVHSYPRRTRFCASRTALNFSKQAKEKRFLSARSRICEELF